MKLSKSPSIYASLPCELDFVVGLHFEPNVVQILNAYLALVQNSAQLFEAFPHDALFFGRTGVGLANQSPIQFGKLAIQVAHMLALHMKCAHSAHA